MNSLNQTVKQIFLEEFARYITDNADQSIDNETVANVSNELNAVLQESGALVAGGFLTRCANIAQNGMEGEDRRYIMRGADIDIYVPCNNLEMVSTFFSSVTKFVINRTNTVKAYDQSFFRKNNIMQRFHYRIPAGMENWTRRGRRKSIDIMSIKQGVSPLNVVQNFDLTFCEIWYDGRSINATNLADAAQKKGLLRSDYVKALLDFNNRFIRDRLERYRGRGYKIKFQLDNMSNVPFATFKSRKSISDMQTWLYLAIYNSITEAFIPRPSETNKFWKLSDASSWPYRNRQQDLFSQLRYMFQIANNLCNYDDVNNICVRFMSRQAIRLAAQTISEAAEFENPDFADRIRPLLNDDVKLFQLLISARCVRQGAMEFNLILFAGSFNNQWARTHFKPYIEVVEQYFMMSTEDFVRLGDMVTDYDAEISVTLDSEHVDVPVCDASLPGAKQGIIYPVELFRSLIIPNDSSYLNLEEEVDCDVGQPLPVSANIHSVENPVQVIVKQGDEAVVDTSAGKPYIFCAAELRSYLISVRQFDPWNRGEISDVHEMGQTGEPLQQYMNPINRKKIVAVRFMTQDEIDETQREYLASQEENISRISDEETAINQLMTSAQQRAMRSANRNRIRASMNIRGNTNSPLRRYLVQEPCMNDDDVDQILEWDPDGDPTDEQLEELTEDCRRAAMEIASERGRRLAMEVMETMEQQPEEKESEEEEEFTSVSDLADSLRNVQEEYFDGPAPDRRSPNQSPQYVPRSPSHSPPPIRRLRNWSENSTDSDNNSPD